MKLPSEIYLEWREQLKGAKWYEIQRAERALIERAEKAEANLSNYESMKMTNEAMSKKLLELEAQIPKWIPVGERLPEEKVPVLVRMAYWRCDVCYRLAESYVQDVRPQHSNWWVTHWMPLPPTE